MYQMFRFLLILLIWNISGTIFTHEFNSPHSIQDCLSNPVTFLGCQICCCCVLFYFLINLKLFFFFFKMKTKQ